MLSQKRGNTENQTYQKLVGTIESLKTILELVIISRHHYSVDYFSKMGKLKEINSSSQVN